MTEAFRQGLRDLGYLEDQTIALELRWDEHHPERWPALAADLVRLRVDCIVAGTTAATWAAKHATSTIPIVMPVSGDPVGVGLVASLAQPGGNVTGLSVISPELNGKRLELLTEAVPSLTRVALLLDAGDPRRHSQQHDHEAAARVLGGHLQPLEVRDPDEFAGAFQAAIQERAQALIMVGSPLFSVQRAQLAELALASRLPTMADRCGVCQSGWAHGVWGKSCGHVAARRSLRAQDPPRGEASRPARGAADEVRTGHQSQDRPGPWPDDAPGHPIAGQ